MLFDKEKEKLLVEKNKFIEILSEEKNEIDELKKIIKDNCSLPVEIKKIKDELSEIETTFKSMEKELNNKIKHIQEIGDKINLLNFEIQSRDIDIMASIISSNLPDGFDGNDASGGIESSEEYDESSLKIIELHYKAINKINLKKGKAIPQIGRINILVTEDKQFKVIVTLGDKMKPLLKKQSSLFLIVIEYIN